MTRQKNFGNVYIPPRNVRWQEWRSILVSLTLVSGLVVGWCVIGEWILP